MEYDDYGKRNITNWRKANYARRYMRHGRMIAPGRKGFHGTIGNYNNWGCRCPECTQAKSNYDKDYRNSK